LHDICHIVHTDLKPENILIKTNASTTRLTSEARKAGLVMSSKRPPLISLFDRQSTRSNKTGKVKSGAPVPPGITVQIADFGNAHVFVSVFMLIAVFVTKRFSAKPLPRRSRHGSTAQSKCLLVLPTRNQQTSGRWDALHLK
jgi:serine/threonine protein kinase